MFPPYYMHSRQLYSREGFHFLTSGFVVDVIEFMSWYFNSWQWNKKCQSEYNSGVQCPYRDTWIHLSIYMFVVSLHPISHEKALIICKDSKIFRSSRKMEWTVFQLRILLWTFRTCFKFTSILLYLYHIFTISYHILLHIIFI